MNTETKIFVKNGIIFRPEDSLLFDTESGRMIEFNETATEILVLVTQHNNFGEICVAMQQTYCGTAMNEVVAYVQEFINDLVNRGILYYEE